MDTYGIEVKIAVSPSPDNKYVFVDYYVYDKNGQGGSTGRTIKMGTGTDVMIGGTQEDDYATVYKNDRGFHMVNQHVKTTFDCITNDSSLGVTPPDTRWIGHYNSWGSNVFNESSNDVVSGTDSGMAYSWEFQLHPYETVHRRLHLPSETPPIMYQTSTARTLPAQKEPTAVLLKPLNMRLIKSEITRGIFM